MFALVSLEAALASGQGPRQAAKQRFLDLPRQPLSREHKAFDTPARCPDCHVGYTVRIDDNKCLTCHDHQNLRGQIKRGAGFHATRPVKSQRCQACHLDHRGQSFNLMAWKTVRGGEANFNHELAGWPLDGAHASATCKACHQTRNVGGRRTFLDTDANCRGCHPPRHGSPLYERGACERCHLPTHLAFSPPSFDHAGEAGFDLARDHAGVRCSSCHVAALGASVPEPACTTCHEKKYARFTLVPPACQRCHRP